MTTLVNEILHTLDGLDLKIEQSRKYYGSTHLTKGWVKVGTRFGDVINTIVHELMHQKHPNKSEDEIIKLSNKVERKLSMSDQAEILKAYEGGIMKVRDLSKMRTKDPKLVRMERENKAMRKQALSKTK